MTDDKRTIQIVNHTEDKQTVRLTFEESRADQAGMEKFMPPALYAG